MEREREREGGPRGTPVMSVCLGNQAGNRWGPACAPFPSACLLYSPEEAVCSRERNPGLVGLLVERMRMQSRMDLGFGQCRRYIKECSGYLGINDRSSLSFGSVNKHDGSAVGSVSALASAAPVTMAKVQHFNCFAALTQQ